MVVNEKDRVLEIRSIKIAEARSMFPATQDSTYLSVCDRGIMADSTAAAMLRYTNAMQGSAFRKSDHEEVVASARQRFSRLINAKPLEIALVSNVSDGVNTIAWAMPWKAGDNVVMCSALEHPNNIYPWLRLRRLGVEIRDVAADNGRIDSKKMIEAIDDRTRIVTCASVTFSPGLRTDLASIGRECRKRNVFFLVDGVQSIGILQHDVEAEYIDGLTTSTSKGLLGAYGCGFLYCRQDWADRLEPAYLSRTGVAVSQMKPSEMGQFDYEYQAGALRFEVGSHNFAGAYAAEASLELIEAIGNAHIESHAVALGCALSKGLSTMGLPVFCASPDQGLAHMVTVGQLGDGGHSVTRDERLQAWSDHVLENGVIHTIRRGQVRFAFHLYNSNQDVEFVLGETERFFH
jgi:cysteine desulfurase / selenocysteine lyase